MRRQRSRYLIVPILLALTAAGCSEDITTTPTDPSQPAVITEDFAGTITVNGAATHTFTVSRDGSVTATLVSLSPDDTIHVGFSMGTWNGASCQTVLSRDSASVGNNLLGATTAGGVLCLRIYDIGEITQPTNYELRAVHP
jgi:hypothetical protein